MTVVARKTPGDAPLSTTHWIAKRIRQYFGHLILSFLLASLAGLIANADPLLMRHWLDISLPQRQLVNSLVMVALIALCFIGRTAINGLASLLGFRVSQLLGHDLRSELLEHMTRLSADWHENTLLGEKLSRIEQDTEQIAQFSADALGTVLRSLIFFLLNLVIMFTLSWRMALTVLPLLPLFFVVRWRFRRLIASRADRAQAELGKASSQFAEHLNAVPEIQALGAEQRCIDRSIEVRRDMMGAQWSQRRAEIAFSVAVTAVMAFGILLLLGLGSHEYLEGSLTIGTLVAFYAYVTRVFDPVSTAMELYSRSQRMMASIRRVRDVLETDTSVPDFGHIDIGQEPRLRLGLACRDLEFRYTSDNEVLRQVSFHLAPGERIALIGESGSGKSSLALLLARMADPKAGEIEFEGMPLQDYTLAAVRRAICYVSQHPVLFSGSIRENLQYAREHASLEEMKSALKAAQLRALIERLPKGIDTLLGPGASSLSGGERQRLAVARALLRESAILILDEATSALDMPTERRILNSISRWNANQSIVFISHRVRSITWVDRIILLDRGRIVAEGNHELLYRQSAAYRRLFEKDEGPEPVEETAVTRLGVLRAGGRSNDAEQTIAFQSRVSSK
ncbi:ABC transporter ATP-binding protein [Acidicapsa dinghuensis]|uniref:ABC transporter ATP-binding protein n=1 Tax=Acidicapsa dinghuensis TaxID=2218256 RepID=A0ABW1ED38_9BACT|nr:ABC transporter ATP-binding protein [Acidicapsa dinghuensis]